ncbi:hypothetical protein A8B82_16570 [Sulfitobacter sp. EhC04]|uniref:GNAT family N-acetyltransferase n=1 Tax=Sulfitobacter sp. EhC04 TaxID=1849168 RepID=UPI0007F4CA50|nr:GNAT family N-acetyltransferase [Sulfitobacter sp. EhC04]OAN75421.1 hypothetical protein A8B82_16570 [Sulfitobacter sp. EhC04]
MPDIPYSIQPAESPADLAAVRALCWDYRAALIANSETDRQITETFYPVPKYETLMRDLPRLHARPRGVILLARDPDGTPIGCGMSHPLDAETAEIKRVYVTPAARGLGLAKALCRALIEQARADGYGRVVLDTSRHLPAAAPLYRALGFADRGPYQDIPSSALPHLLFFEYALT